MIYNLYNISIFSIFAGLLLGLTLEFKLIVLKQMIGKNDSNLNLKITFRPAGLPFKVKRVTNCEI